MYSCNICRQSFSTRDEYNIHISNHLQSKDWYLFRSAFSGATKIFRRELNIASFMELFLIKKSVQLLIEKELLLFPQLKLNISVNADYQLGNEDENPQIEEFVLKSENYIVSSSRKTSCELSVENCVLLTTPTTPNVFAGYILLYIATLYGSFLARYLFNLNDGRKQSYFS